MGRIWITAAGLLSGACIVLWPTASAVAAGPTWASPHVLEGSANARQPRVAVGPTSGNQLLTSISADTAIAPGHLAAIWLERPRASYTQYKRRVVVGTATVDASGST